MLKNLGYQSFESGLWREKSQATAFSMPLRGSLPLLQV